MTTEISLAEFVYILYLQVLFLSSLCLIALVVYIVTKNQGLIRSFFFKVKVSLSKKMVTRIANALEFLRALRRTVATESTHHGGELVAEVLKAHGVKNIFTLVGGHVSPILVAAEKQDIRVVDTRHEVTAVFAADAVARMSGTVGVAVVTAGPGVTNTITAVKNAQMAESPILLLGGAAATILKGRGALQDIDQMSLLKPLCKFCESVTTVRDIVPTIRKAINVAVSGTPGPAFVELPIDILYPYKLVRDQMGIKANATTIGQKIVNWYLQMYLNNVFGDAWENKDCTPLPTSHPQANAQEIQRCAEIISKAKKPVIILGSQATLPPTPIDDLRKTVEALGIPCFLGGMARGLLRKESPLQMKHRRREALQDADVVILAGAVCDFRLSYGRILNRKSKVIAINRDKIQLHKNTDVYWKPTEAILADIGSFLVGLLAALKDYKCDPSWIQELRLREDEKESTNKLMARDLPAEHLNPLNILQTLDRVLDDDAILVADGGDFVGTAAYTLRARGPLQWLDPGAFGTLGVGGGFALGAKICRPESEVWLIYGDGSCAYSIAEFDTFKRHKLPILALVGNDAGWTQISREQLPMFGSNVACDLLHTDYHIVAEGFGGKGFLIKQEDNDNMEMIFRKAQAECKDGKSVLLNVLVGKSKFREGSISV